MHTVLKILSIIILGGCTSYLPVVHDTEVKDNGALLADRLIKRLESRGAFFEDPATESIILAILKKFSLPAERSLTLRLVRNPLPNATILADGTLCVHSGLIAKLTHPNQLAFILAHEISHWRSDHSRRKGDAAGTIGLASTLLDTVATPLMSKVLPKSVTEETIDFLTEAVGSRYSRDLEREADAQALTLMKEFSFDVARVADVFLIYRAYIEKFSIPQRLVIFSTHPSVEERYEIIREWLLSHSLPLSDVPLSDPSFITATSDLRLKNARWNRQRGRYFETLEELSLVRGVDWNVLAAERADTYRKMVEEFGRAKRSVSNDFWEREYPGIDDTQVKTLWFFRARALYSRVLNDEPSSIRAQRGRGLLLAHYGDEEGKGDLIEYLHNNPDAADVTHVAKVLKETYGNQK